MTQGKQDLGGEAAVIREALTWALDEHDYNGTENPLAYVKEALEAHDALEARLAEAKRRDDWMRTQLANCIEDLERLESMVLDAKGWRCLIGDLRDALAALPPESETAV